LCSLRYFDFVSAQLRLRVACGVLNRPTGLGAGGLSNKRNIEPSGLKINCSLRYFDFVSAQLRLHSRL
jgi:hypothetical protein